MSGWSSIRQQTGARVMLKMLWWVEGVGENPSLISCYSRPLLILIAVFQGQFWSGKVSDQWNVWFYVWILSVKPHSLGHKSVGLEHWAAQCKPWWCPSSNFFNAEKSFLQPSRWSLSYLSLGWACWKGLKEWRLHSNNPGEIVQCACTSYRVREFRLARFQSNEVRISQGLQ